MEVAQDQPNVPQIGSIEVLIRTIENIGLIAYDQRLDDISVIIMQSAALIRAYAQAKPLDGTVAAIRH